MFPGPAATHRSGNTIFGRPLVSVWVGPAPACAVSRCQGGTVSVAADGAANGTFYDRLSGGPTASVTLEDTDFLRTGTGVVHMRVIAQGGQLECFLTYSARRVTTPGSLGI